MEVLPKMIKISNTASAHGKRNFMSVNGSGNGGENKSAKIVDTMICFRVILISLVTTSATSGPLSRRRVGVRSVAGFEVLFSICTASKHPCGEVEKWNHDDSPAQRDKNACCDE